jgi:hypothetical protein
MTSRLWRLSVVLVLAWVTMPLAATAAGPLVINGSELRKTYDCKGDTAVINGGGSVLTFRNCREITVNGGENTVDTGIVEVINATGADNKITWTETPDGKRPAITNTGENNVITSKPAPSGDAAKAPKGGSKKSGKTTGGK